MVVERGACGCLRVARAPHRKLMFSQEVEEVVGPSTIRIRRGLLKSELGDVRCFSPLIFAHAAHN